MTDDNDNNRHSPASGVPSGAGGRAPLTLKPRIGGAVNAGVVKQSFSHGRSKSVVVETKRARFAPPPQGVAEPRAPAPVVAETPPAVQEAPVAAQTTDAPRPAAPVRAPLRAGDAPRPALRAEGLRAAQPRSGESVRSQPGQTRTYEPGRERQHER